MPYSSLAYQSLKITEQKSKEKVEALQRAALIERDTFLGNGIAAVPRFYGHRTGRRFMRASIQQAAVEHRRHYS
jgi:hypothetical protein